MTRIGVKLWLVGVLLVGGVLGSIGAYALDHGASQPAYAQGAGACSNAMLNGTYGVLAQGFSVNTPDGTPLDLPLPRAVLNVLTLDGAGNVSRSQTANAAGVVSRAQSAGTYTVSADCTF